MNITETFDAYKSKWIGSDISKHPPRVNFFEAAKSTIGAFVGILTLSIIDNFWLLSDYDNTQILYGSLGAGAVLVHCAPKAPLSQPWNAIVGHIVGSIVGVTVRYFSNAIGIAPYVQKAMAVAFTIFFTSLFDCVHPPAGATSLIAIIGGPKIHAMGYKYCIYISSAGIVMVLSGLIMNNIWESRSYPVYWHYLYIGEDTNWSIVKFFHRCFFPKKYFNSEADQESQSNIEMSTNRDVDDDGIGTISNGANNKNLEVYDPKVNSV